MKIQGNLLILIVVTMSIVAGCASVTPHQPLPSDFKGLAQIPGIPLKGRFWGDLPPPWADRWQTLSKEELADDFSGIMGREHNYLAISGGGAEGAFGAGLLVGWSATGTRPEFTIVTGVSTGALTAPFAFLGPEYDAQLEEIYTTLSTKDLLRRRSILSIISGDAAMGNEPIYAQIKKYIDQKVVDAIATENTKGRKLFIGTTNLEAGRPVIWNITEIAASGHPQASELIHKVLLASASIPAAFPPIFIEVEANGQRYDEIHVDGGTTTQIFLYPVGVKWSTVIGKLEIKGTPNLYLIRNARLYPQMQPIDPKIIPIAGSAITSLIRTQGIGDMYRLYYGAVRDGLNYNLAFIPADFNEKPSEIFDPNYMRQLFDLGYQMAESGEPWLPTPPTLKDL
ncbi:MULTISPECIES: patatin-like phospholipase family protein [Desulfosediminicola]|uniref:patatin-like phospholipase family protein n=1 Tax=Desulfosediminicola TaxID=2886823 RepID=UPI001C3C8409|nr:patatin-like phospholipase family protein [Desulfosediminicola ganghwensis]